MGKSAADCQFFALNIFENILRKNITAVIAFSGIYGHIFLRIVSGRLAGHPNTDVLFKGFVL